MSSWSTSADSSTFRFCHAQSLQRAKHTVEIDSSTPCSALVTKRPIGLCRGGGIVYLPDAPNGHERDHPMERREIEFYVLLVV